MGKEGEVSLKETSYGRSKYRSMLLTDGKGTKCT